MKFAVTRTVGYASLLRLNSHAHQVPVIAVFTKFEAFRHNIQLDLEDDDQRQQVNPQDECERIFKAEYLGRLGKGPKFVRLEGKPS
jgi:hypothetical protein